MEPTRLPRRLGDLLAVVLYLGLGLLVMGRYLAHPDQVVDGPLPADNTWFEWVLEHAAYCVRHLENPLFTRRQHVPDGVNMMANNSVLGVTLPLAPLTMAAGAKVSYLVWMVLAGAGTAASWSSGNCSSPRNCCSSPRLRPGPDNHVRNPPPDRRTQGDQRPGGGRSGGRRAGRLPAVDAVRRAAELPRAAAVPRLGRGSGRLRDHAAGQPGTSWPGGPAPAAPGGRTGPGSASSGSSRRWSRWSRPRW